MWEGLNILEGYREGGEVVGRRVCRWEVWAWGSFYRGLGMGRGLPRGVGVQVLDNSECGNCLWLALEVGSLGFGGSGARCYALLALFKCLSFLLKGVF